MEKPQLKLDGKNLVLTWDFEAKIDTDKDGAPAATLVSKNQIVVDGTEVIDELLKSSEIAQKAKELLNKLGL